MRKEQIVTIAYAECLNSLYSSVLFRCGESSDVTTALFVSKPSLVMDCLIFFSTNLVRAYVL